MSQSNRGQFSSKWGFIFAASGSAVGLGNIWGFPTQAASNGGGAFLFVYLVMAFFLAYPVLTAELLIGRYTQSNPVKAFSMLSSSQAGKNIGSSFGGLAIVTASLILSFYAIVGGWLIAHVLADIANVLGQEQAAQWMVTMSISRNLVFTFVFMALTVGIIMQGVKDGIEKWASLLMPCLLVILVALTVYVLTLEGAVKGLSLYLIPNPEKLLDVNLLISALGQAFFSLSLGVGTMLVYGSYISKNENLPSLAKSVTLMDVGIAVLAGLLILPAIFVAQANGLEIYSEDGQLLNGDRLIFEVIPALFGSMSGIGKVLSFLFFFLLSLAALTSSISMLEVPVTYAVESTKLSRVKAAIGVTIVIVVLSVLIIYNFWQLFGLVVSISTEYSQPLLGLFLAIYVGWVWSRNKILMELKLGFEVVETSFFWKVWPAYVRFICPAAIALVFIQQILR